MRIHLIAIGGSIMHSLAIALKNNGHEVSGSDDIIYDPARSRLHAVGLLPSRIGWDSGNISENLDLVILGMHAKEDNPELLRAQEIGVPIQSFPEFLGAFAKNKMVLAICGSHGKTTTTSMVMHVLKHCEREFDYAVGAALNGFDNMTKLSEAPIFVVEGDEYLSSCLDRRPKFLHYDPDYAVVTGIAWDHFNVFPTLDLYYKAFTDLVHTVGVHSRIYYNRYDEAVRQWAWGLKKDSLIPYKTLELSEVNGELYYNKGAGQMIQLPFFGRHNMENALAAWSLISSIGIEEGDFIDALLEFSMPDRRLNEKNINGVFVVNDFAHAPSKVAASVKAVRQKYPQSHLKVILELHTYSSLNKAFVKQYKDSLKHADKAAIFYNPKNLEIKRLEAISPDEIRVAFNYPSLDVFQSADRLKSFLNDMKTGNVLLLMSSSNFGGVDIEGLISNMQGPGLRYV